MPLKIAWTCTYAGLIALKTFNFSRQLDLSTLNVEFCQTENIKALIRLWLSDLLKIQSIITYCNLWVYLYLHKNI
jgi:hypothetical protein